MYSCSRLPRNNALAPRKYLLRIVDGSALADFDEENSKSLICFDSLLTEHTLYYKALSGWK